VERDHAASITEYLDKDVGRILDKLEELGIANNTLVLFTSDNGPHNEGGHDVHFFNSSGPFRGFKRSLYEGGIRVPFVASWPDGPIQASVTRNDVAWFPDIMNTLAEVAGVQHLVPTDTDGSSLVGLLTGKGSSPPPPVDRVLYWEFCTDGTWGQAVRQGEWKLISLDRPHKPWELYNLTDDPGETQNLADSDGFRSLVQRLELGAERAHVDDPNWPTGRACIPSDSFEHSISFALDFS
jgi:arylsulfatase A-like enzyme